MVNIHVNGPSDGREPVRVVYLSVMNRDAALIGRAFSEMAGIPVPMRLVCADSEELDSDEEGFVGFLHEVREADLVIAKLHGDQSYFRKWDRMMDVVGRGSIDFLYDGALEELNDDHRHMFRHTDEDWLLMRTLAEIGGRENHESMILWILNRIAGADVGIRGPTLNRTEGVFHPDWPEDTGFDEYISSLDPSRPTVAVMMHQTSWLKDRRKPVVDLIRRLEELGANTLPVFFTSAPNELSGSIGIGEVVDRYLRRDGRPIVDTVVFTTGFSQVCMNNVSADTVPRNFFEDLDVPVIQAMTLSRPVERWMADGIGLSSMELGSAVIWPEFDGQMISVPSSFNYRDPDGVYRSDSVPDRVDRIATLAVAWAELRRKPVSERRVAILLNMYPPTNDRIGGASGLDSLESVRRCLIAMRDTGYTVDDIPADGNSIVGRLMEGVTSDTRWIPEDELESRSHTVIPTETYLGWYSGLSEKARAGIEVSWGEPPGDISTCGSGFLVPGYLDGNVFIGIQPNRGQHEQAEKLYHDPFVVMPHQYLAYYRWLKHGFGADCIIHMGTHGTLEWLPGKGNGLSSDCYPDVVLDTMPNIDPYIIDDPGEGVQCKRRTNSVLISHMCPSMTRAGNYDELMALEGTLQEYLNSRSTLQQSKRRALDESILERVAELDMFAELGLQPDCTPEDVDAIVDEIYDYIADLKDAVIKDGLHVLGEVPEGERLREMVYSLCRLRNGDVPSLRGCVCTAMGYDLDALLDSPSSVDPATGRTFGSILDEVDGAFNGLIDTMDGLGFVEEACVDAARGTFGDLDEGMERSIRYVCGTVFPGIMAMGDEIGNLLVGLDGRYVPPGPSGSPTRGNAHLLPTGRNIYSIDPDAIPSEASWRVGSRMAEDMVSRYVEENGRYPENVGIVVWATDTMKTYGDDVAYILALLGVRPTWGTVGGKVTGMEVIPLEELGRPRIDVMPRISGLFRDSFPNLTEMLVDALAMVAALDESEEENYYRKHLEEDIRRFIDQGLMPSEARDLAGIRVFGDPPGQHGCGVSVLIASSKWDSLDQIAETYATWGSHAYGGGWKGEKVPLAFKMRLGSLDVTVKNHNDREFDLLDIDDDYDSLGGMNAAVRTYGGHTPVTFMGDSSDVDRLRTRTLEEETAYVMRSRVLNPKWAEGLKRHGYKGAMELSKLTEYMLGWSATSDSIEPWMFSSVTDMYILDEGMREWITENNPDALREMIDDMLEAVHRGLWDADEDTVRELTDLFLETEGLLEDMSGGE